MLYTKYKELCLVITYNIFFKFVLGICLQLQPELNI